MSLFFGGQRTRNAKCSCVQILGSVGGGGGGGGHWGHFAPTENGIAPAGIRTHDFNTRQNNVKLANTNKKQSMKPTKYKLIFFLFKMATVFLCSSLDND